MTPLATGSVILATFEGTSNGQQIINTHHFEFVQPGGAPDYRVELNDLLDKLTVAGGWADDILAAANVSYKLEAIHAQPITPQRMTRVTRIVGTAGSRGGTALPQNVAAVIERKSDNATRWGRGNWHFCGLQVGDATNGIVQAAMLALLATVGDNFATTYVLTNGGEMRPILWSPKVPGRKTPITAFSVKNTVRVMRRRTVGLGS